MSKSRRIIVSATGRERGFTESLAAFPEKREGKRRVVMVAATAAAAEARGKERRVKRRKGRKMTARLSNGSIYLPGVGRCWRGEGGSRYVYRRRITGQRNGYVGSLVCRVERCGAGCCGPLGDHFPIPFRLVLLAIHLFRSNCHHLLLLLLLVSFRT